MSWPMVALGELVEILSGFAFKSEQFNSDGEGLPLVRIRDVKPRTSQTYYKGEFQEKFVVKDGDLLVGMDGEFNCAPWAGGRALLNQRVCRVSAKSGKIDQAYLNRFLPAALKEIEDKTNFVTVKHLSGKQIADIKIPLPPLPEQRRIAGILDQADALRRLRRQSLSRLSDLGQAIFYEMFGDPISNPKGWDKVELVECVASSDDIRCGPFGTQLLREEFQEDGVPLWGIKQVNRGFAIPTHEFVTEKKAKVLANYTIIPGDIVMTRKGTIGNCSVYPKEFPVGIMHSDLLRLRIDRNKCEPEFISDQLHFSPDIQHQIALISGGAIMQGIRARPQK